MRLLLQAFCEIESGIPAGEMGLLFNGIPLLDNKKTLQQYGINEGNTNVFC